MANSTETRTKRVFITALIAQQLCCGSGGVLMLPCHCKSKGRRSIYCMALLHAASAVKRNLSCGVSVLPRPWLAFYSLHSCRRKDESGWFAPECHLLFLEHEEK